jgi:hypothetical protein
MPLALFYFALVLLVLILLLASPRALLMGAVEHLLLVANKYPEKFRWALLWLMWSLIVGGVITRWHPPASFLVSLLGGIPLTIVGVLLWRNYRSFCIAVGICLLSLLLILFILVQLFGRQRQNQPIRGARRPQTTLVAPVMPLGQQRHRQSLYRCLAS